MPTVCDDSAKEYNDVLWKAFDDMLILPANPNSGSNICSIKTMKMSIIERQQSGVHAQQIERHQIFPDQIISIIFSG